MGRGVIMESFWWTYLHWFDDMLFVFCVIGVKEVWKVLNRRLGKTNCHQDLRPGNRGNVVVQGWSEYS
jgi:hypothetical protein